MSALGRRGPYANKPAKLPGLPAERIADGPTREAVAALREWVEVRLGARGDPFERAVTQREFTTRLTELRGELTNLIGAIDSGAASSATPTPASTAPAGQIPASLLNRINALELAVAAQAQQIADLIAVANGPAAAPLESLTLLPPPIQAAVLPVFSVGPDL